MTLLFIENRYKTYLFQPIAEKLSSEGHEIHWIVQNRKFLPKGNFNLHTIKYPKNVNSNSFKKDKFVEDVIYSDRQINHFKKRDTSYFYYYNSEIRQRLENIRPDIVFGESTAFHELLTINNCKALDILYLNPSTCRYPVGRFSFYKYDTLEPHLGSEEKLSNDDALTVIDSIIHRKTLPDYMKPVKKTRFKEIKDQIKKAYAYFDGERYNTPNPLVKYRIEKAKSTKIEKWNNISVSKVKEDSSFKVLYPLQMQPEANIDVWGRKYRDQTELIKRISENLPKEAVLYVKPNPKSKYELNDALYDVVNTRENVIVLNHSTKMDEVIKNIGLVVTVTGTIAIECILNNKPVVNLVKTVNNRAKNCIFINTVDELKGVVNAVENNSFETINDQEKADFINVLNKTSYRGIISDPFSDNNCVSEGNIDTILFAFKDILSDYSGGKY